MSAITQVPFYPSDWLAGTRGMTAPQMGVYITLIAMMYERAGPIRCDDLPKLARLCGTSASAMKGLLEDLISDGKITRDGDLLSNRRAMLEIENVMAKSEVARDKANARWQKKPEKSIADECSGMLPAMQAISHKPVDISSLRSDSAPEIAPAAPIESPKAEKKRRKAPTRPYPDGYIEGVEIYDVWAKLVADDEANDADFDRLASEFRDYHLARGTLFADWGAAFRTWVRNDRKFARERCRRASDRPRQSQFVRH